MILTNIHNHSHDHMIFEKEYKCAKLNTREYSIDAHKSGNMVSIRVVAVHN